jgi:hypothetical protein
MIVMAQRVLQLAESDQLMHELRQFRCLHYVVLRHNTSISSARGKWLSSTSSFGLFIIEAGSSYFLSRHYIWRFNSDSDPELLKKYNLARNPPKSHHPDRRHHVNQ